MSRSATAGLDPPGLEVVALILVDGSHRRGVTAAHVVLLDIEIRNRIGVGTLGQNEIVVRLEGVGPRGRRCGCG